MSHNKLCPLYYLEDERVRRWKTQDIEHRTQEVDAIHTYHCLCSNNPCFLEKSESFHKTLLHSRESSKGVGRKKVHVDNREFLEVGPECAGLPISWSILLGCCVLKWFSELRWKLVRERERKKFILEKESISRTC